jgi:quercetin dioxygenase-like cupin family protein
MIALDARQAAREATAAASGRPAMAIIHDSDDTRLVVFRIGPGQAVPPHRSPSTVHLTVLEGSGVLSGGDGDGAREHACAAGDVVVYVPNETHGMRAENETLLLLAAITPRPGSR